MLVIFFKSKVTISESEKLNNEQVFKGQIVGKALLTFNLFYSMLRQPNVHLRITKDAWLVFNRGVVVPVNTKFENV